MTPSEKSVTITLPVTTASVVLAELMKHDNAHPVDVQLYSWSWHIKGAREAVKQALLEWGR